MSDSVFAPNALDANRTGQLGAEQRAELEAAVSRNLGRIMGVALRRSYPLAKDLPAGHVESIEGAVTKRIGSNWDYALASALANTLRGNEPTDYRISVANRERGAQEFRSDQDVYEFAPDAGMVRLFYLPHSRWVVNLEWLPDLPVDASPDGVERAVEDFAAAAARDKVAAAEARARLAAIDREIKAYLPDKTSLVPNSAQPAVLAKAILGDWTSPFLGLSIGADGTFAARLTDGSRSEGRWSLDASGQLHAELMGAPIVADVSVNGDELTMIVNDQAVKLRRATTD